MEISDPSSSPDEMNRVEQAETDNLAAIDLDAIRKAVEDSASVSTGLWISYLFMYFYIAIAAGAVTHLDLLLGNPVKLPFLGIELPLLAFFLVAPVLFLIVHAYTLVHFVLLGEKTAQFNESLDARFPVRTTAMAEPAGRGNSTTREGVRRQLPSNIFVQFLAGPSDIRNTPFGQLLRSIAWITLVFSPIALFLELQIQFLPYHLVSLTWLHRTALLFDIILIWWLWKKIVGHTDLQASNDWRSRTRTAAGATLSVLAIWFSWSLATIPDEWQEFTGCGWLYNHLFYGVPDPNTHRPASLFSNRLVLPGLNVYDILKVDDPQKVGWRPYLLTLRSRDLKGAIFDEAFLPRTDAQYAQLQGASLYFANLQGSMLRDANLQGANLPTAQLQGANLVRAHLEGAMLSGVALQGANLESAHLKGADLSVAQLQGVNFHGADLSGAILFQASLRGTAFGPIEGVPGVPAQITNLQGANFDQATFDVVSLDRSLLWRSVFASDDKTPKITNIFGTPEWAAKDVTRPWGAKSYKELQDKLKALAENTRTTVLNHIGILDCAQTSPAIASCDPVSTPPPNVSQWRDEIKNATLDQASYAKALASVYVDLICSGDGSSLAILRSMARMGMPDAAGGMTKTMGFLETGTEAAGLVDTIMNTNAKTSAQCVVSTQLTDADKALLLTVKRLSASAANSTSNHTPQK